MRATLTVEGHIGKEFLFSGLVDKFKKKPIRGKHIFLKDIPVNIYISIDLLAESIRFLILIV